jgi:hypothetical protein
VKGTIIGRLVATPIERKTLERVLKEMRHAVAEGTQMQIIFDPWTTLNGAHLTVIHDGRGFGRTYDMPGRFRAKRRVAKLPPARVNCRT